MFAIVNSDNLEVYDLLDYRPRIVYNPPLVYLYVTTNEASSIVLPKDSWIVDAEDPNISHRVHTSGSILTQVQYDFAVNRQKEIRTAVEIALNFAKNIQGVQFSDLDPSQIKGLLGLMCASAGWIAPDGSLDLLDITIDNVFRDIMSK